MATSSERAKAWKLANPAKAAEQNRRAVNAYRHRNPLKWLANALAWNTAHPERHLAVTTSSRRRGRASKSGARIIDSVTADDWTVILEMYRHRCAYCGRPGTDLTQDHVTPLSKGGEHSFDNVVPACGACNSRKYDHGLLEFTFGIALNA